MCIHAHTWRRKLARLTRESDLEKLKQEFAEMYAEHTDATAADSFSAISAGRTQLPTPNRSPIRVALFYILVCTCVAAIILLILLISR